MSIQDEIATAKATAARRLRRLNEQARREQQAIDARVLVLLHERHPNAADKLEAEARDLLAAETAQRSVRAKAAHRRRSGEQHGVHVVAGSGVDDHYDGPSS
ncbi:hypothetical protein [Candidatus Microthrix parvicella]|uniref:Uncharacterized protein n=1 Tax=Candidatus Neomicrothrix parvicella RN1 TaxID=1229780 RepID=R4YVL1_9ACTN|nr:hypothetical protein [Candidatus Microthrix parvicella]CCM62039.1 hypothetical protein BN381_10270 [Candidatus Microthrix parvicella RN1]